jgi:hypothetical protein
MDLMTQIIRDYENRIAGYQRVLSGVHATAKAAQAFVCEIEDVDTLWNVARTYFESIQKTTEPWITGAAEAISPSSAALPARCGSQDVAAADASEDASVGDLTNSRS